MLDDLDRARRGDGRAGPLICRIGEEPLPEGQSGRDPVEETCCAITVRHARRAQLDAPHQPERVRKHVALMPFTVETALAAGRRFAARLSESIAFTGVGNACVLATEMPEMAREGRKGLRPRRRHLAPLKPVSLSDRSHSSAIPALSQTWGSSVPLPTGPTTSMRPVEP